MKTHSRRDECIARMTRGEGFMPWQKPGLSDAEHDFRARMEARKDRLLAGRQATPHPFFYTEEDVARARRNIARASWAQRWFAEQKQLGDYLLSRPEAWIASLIPTLTPGNPFAFTCPRCVGRKSIEGVGVSGYSWDYHDPERIRCKACGIALPDSRYPETGRLVCPRMGQTFTYYRNERERRAPGDRGGRLAWRWVGQPVHPSYAGIARHEKAAFAITAMKTLAVVCRLTGDCRYAVLAARLLSRFAEAYSLWLYHDFYDTMADCDPLYAAWHYCELRLEWKRHPCAHAYTGSRYETGPINDRPRKAKMLAVYFGSGRIHPSCDAISRMDEVALTYDLIHDANDPTGPPVLNADARRRIERDLLLEWAFGAEYWLGGPGQAASRGNKAPYAYRGFAALGRCLGLAEFVDTALRGYEGIRDESFLADGFTRESPAYTNMFLGNIVWAPELLDGYRWPRGFDARRGTVRVFARDCRLRRIMRAAVETLRPDGRLLPLSDSGATYDPSLHVYEIGRRHYPELFRSALPLLYRHRPPTEYAVWRLDSRAVNDRGWKTMALPEGYHPEWMTALLRHGQGPGAAVLAMAFNPAGGHRHADNLGLYYFTRGRAVLAEQGYVCDSPLLAWNQTTLSHNLVVVDDAEQKSQYLRRPPHREPRLRWVAFSPRVSAVEAESDAYEPCSEYRRLVALIKLPGGATFAIDVFRVAGGRKHAYRLFSDLAASDAKGGRRRFVGLNMPTEPPLPDYKGSVAREHIFGLRDTVAVSNPPDAWQAIWEERGMRYRLWMLSPSDRVEASHGPGQQSTNAQVGRRVRYLDVMNEGTDIVSTFVAIHEPGGPRGMMPVRRAQRLAVPERAGSRAVALRIETRRTTFLFCSDFEKTAEIDGIRFRGVVGLFTRRKRSKDIRVELML